MNRERAKVIVRGAVQGVGFRPFVYRLATKLNLDGWVLNSVEGVFIEVEGPRQSLETFLLRLEEEKPPRAVIQSFQSSFLASVGYRGFVIRESDERGEKSALILPDIATCADCLREVFDPDDRRFRYPFTNCTNCGPRFTILEALPYDRAATSMRGFQMCADCEREYHDPRDRRFHAQPNACPRCGPRLQLWDRTGQILAAEDAALIQSVAAVRAGKLLALKGLGGFQLITGARNHESVALLRLRKHREEKPFALMVPSLAAARELCHLSDLEERLLLSPEAPIVLLEKRQHARVSQAVAPGNPNLGLMLPCTPLHHLLLHSLGVPVVATSGNQSDEPICIDEYDALARLRGIADLFLVHDRPIVRHMDDSIVRVMAGREMVLRRARGYAPLPIAAPNGEKAASDSSAKRGTILALGAHLKNSTALRVGDNVFISQHIGDLETPQAYAAFVKSADDLPRLYEANPAIIACDLHPEYLSTKYAIERAADREPTRIQHHWAHVASCLAENEIEPPALGVAWDGTGFGLDGTIWGGEFLRAQNGSFERVAHFRHFQLPGGDAAIKEPRRSALGLLFEIFGEGLWVQTQLLKSFTAAEARLLRRMLERNLNSPLTSSVGRLFDAVAALSGLRARSSFEGQAAMDLEFIAGRDTSASYPFEMRGEHPVVIDWETAILELISDQERGETPAVISAKFHNMLVEIISAIAKKLGEPVVALSGGCFQNRRLLEQTIARLSAENFRPCWHQHVPPNDGGIALGQVTAIRWAMKNHPH